MALVEPYRSRLLSPAIGFSRSTSRNGRRSCLTVFIKRRGFSSHVSEWAGTSLSSQFESSGIEFPASCLVTQIGLGVVSDILRDRNCSSCGCFRMGRCCHVIHAISFSFVDFENPQIGMNNRFRFSSQSMSQSVLLLYQDFVFLLSDISLCFAIARSTVSLPSYLVS